MSSYHCIKHYYYPQAISNSVVSKSKRRFVYLFLIVTVIESCFLPLVHYYRRVHDANPSMVRSGNVILV